MQILMKDYFQARCVELSDELYNDCKGTEHEVLGSGQVDYARKHQVGGSGRNALIWRTVEFCNLRNFMRVLYQSYILLFFFAY